ncbi:MAG: NADH-quinone oxidoreductase subunit N [Janthinobacterium lividum]
MIPALPVTSSDILAVSPLLWVIFTAMIVLMVDLALPRDRKSACVGVSLAGLAVATISCCYLWDKTNSSILTAFNGTVVADDFALAFQVILIIVAALSILLSEKYIQQKGINHGEYYALLLFSTSGAMLMATSRELITIFIGLEVLSIALYILSGFARTEARSEESAMKYFLLGSFSSAFFLYGIALVYGGTGTTRLDTLTTVPIEALRSSYAVAGFALLLIGLGFKAAIVPFHSWTPDVYEGAPTSVTAFMSAGAKCGAFAALVRVAIVLLPLSSIFHDVFWVLAILTMVVGNFVAIVQTNIKRMLAYSSIAHAGYILVGLLAGSSAAAAADPTIRTEAYAGILFYILAYTFMNLGAFGILILLARRGDELNNIEDLQGLAQSQPWAAALMALFMFSLAGVPPAAGFFGKFYVFIAAVHAHQYSLAVIGLVASVVGAAYYLRIVYTMYFQPATREYPTNVWSFSPGANVALILSAIATLAFGVFPSGLYKTAVTGSKSLQVPSVSSSYAMTPSAPVERASIK